MSFSAILHFLVAVSEAPTREILTKELETALGAYGFQYYCFLQQPKPVDNASALIVAANWTSSWVERYSEKKYIISDPTIRYLLRTNRSFAWKEAVEAYAGNPHYNRMKKMMADGKNNGLAAGYVFPVFGRTGLMGATTIGGPDEIDLSPTEMALFEAAFRAAYFRYGDLMGLDLVGQTREGIDVSLTHREIQALSYLAEGMTSQEIGQALDVSPNTVDWYVGSLQAKLNARNRNQAVAFGLRMGLIS